MVRPPSFDSNGVKKGAWSEEEDAILRDHVLRFGHPNWRLLPLLAGLPRCGKSCRLRWVNYLKPGIKKGHFSKEEEDTIIKLHAKLGKKWSDISKLLPGRTDNDIKNYWHAHIKKRSKRKRPYPTVISAPMEKEEESSEIGSSTITVDHQKEECSAFSYDFARDLSAESIVPNAYSDCDLWTDPLFYDQTCFDQDLPPFPEGEFYDLATLCRNNMSDSSSWNRSPAESDENNKSQLVGEDAFDIELWGMMSMFWD